MKNRLFIAFLFFGGSLISIALAGQDADADAVFLSLAKEYRLNEDGSTEIRCVKELKLLTHFAFHSLYGETFVIYDPVYQKLKINEAYTIMADGRKIVTPANAFNEVLPRAASNFTASNHLREMVITHTGLEVGAVIYLDYTIKSIKEYFPALMAKEILNTSSPVDKQIITVDIPATIELHHKTVHIRSAPEIIQENGRKRYTWNFSRSDAKSQESFQPDDAEYLPTLVFSTARDLNDMISAMTSQEAFRMAIDGEMSSRLHLIMEQQADPLNRILDIQKLVADEFNLFDISPVHTGYRLRTPEQTWHSNGGTEIEKSVMLAALLIATGAQANVYAVIPATIMDKSIGCLAAIKGFVVEVSTGDKGRLILSASRVNDQDLMYELSGNVLVSMNPNAESLRVIEIAEQTSIVKADLQLKVDTEHQLTGEISAELGMAMNPYTGIRRDDNILKGQWTSFAAAGYVQSFKVVALSPDQSSIAWNINCTSPLKEQDGYFFLELPAFRNGFNNWQMMYLNSSRIAPVKIPYPLREMYTYSLELPDHLVPVAIPEPVTIANESGSVTIEFTYSNQMIFGKRKLELNDRITDSLKFQDFRTLINEWNDINNQRIILKKTE